MSRRARRLGAALLRKARGKPERGAPAAVPAVVTAGATVGGALSAPPPNAFADLDAVRRAVAPRSRPLIVNHWATWCDGCVEELPDLVRLAGALGEQVEFVGVSWELFSAPRDTALDRVAEVGARYGLGWPSVVFGGPPDELFDGLGLEVQLIPQTFAVMPDGSVGFHHVGPLGSDALAELEGVLRAALRG